MAGPPGIFTRISTHTITNTGHRKHKPTRATTLSKNHFAIHFLPLNPATLRPVFYQYVSMFQFLHHNHITRLLTGLHRPYITFIDAFKHSKTNPICYIHPHLAQFCRDTFPLMSVIHHLAQEAFPIHEATQESITNHLTVFFLHIYYIRPSFQKFPKRLPVKSMWTKPFEVLHWLLSKEVCQPCSIIFVRKTNILQ